MSELQATLEFSVELNKFYNVDLFQRGYYQIRTILKTPPKVPSKIEITLQKSQGEGNQMPAHVVNEMAVSRTFQILYRNEDLMINDVILYRFHTLVDSTRMEEELRKLDIQLGVELWFSEEQNGLSATTSKSECVSQRLLQLHFSPTKGLHHHAPVLFDYFHLSAIEVTVHGTLIAIHQPFLSVPKQPRSAWSSRNPDLSTLETVYFGVRPISGDPEQCSAVNLHQSWQMHHRICNMLLSAYESLQACFEFYLSKLAGSQFKLEHIDCHRKLQNIMDGIQKLDNEEDLIQNGTRDITQLCAANVILWTQFLESASLDQGVIFHLAKEHHTMRIKRFAEGFFTHEYQKNECLLCYEPSYHGHSDLSSLVRSSSYLQSLPPLDLECLELDGDHLSLPIIFEDIYYDQQASPNGGSNRNSMAPSIRSSSLSINMSSPSSQRSKRNFIKNIKPDTFKRPSSYSCTDAEASMNKKSSKDVMLVGYRKTISSPNVQGQILDRKVLELGTLSPNPNVSSSSSSQVPGYMLVNSSSMPSLFRSGWSRNSEGHIPEYMEVARQSLRTKKRNAKSTVITVEFGGSDPQLQGVDDTGTVEERKKLKRAYTDPVRHSSTSSEENRRIVESGKKTENNSGPPETDPSTSSARSSQVSSKTETETDSQFPSVQVTEKAKKQLNFQDELYSSLSASLTAALGDEACNNSDFSDDETCVQNGYDEFLEEHSMYSSKLDPSSESASGSAISKSDEQTAKQAVSQTVTSEDSTGKPPPRLTVRDILEKGELTVAGIEISNIRDGKDSDKVSSAEGEIIQSDSDMADSAQKETEVEKFVSVTDVNMVTEKTDSEFPLVVFEGLDSESVDLSDSRTSFHTPKSELSNTSSDRITIIELLKEEYVKSNKRTSVEASSLQGSSSLSFEGTDSGISSAKSYHKASSDSNILQSVELDHSDPRSEGSKVDCMVSSASFPELSKLTISGPDTPKLVDQVKPSTVSFITMRETLKTRMRYQGNLYSESPTLAAQIPYFHVPDTTEDENQRGCHMVVCVHGLDGNSADLRLVKTYMEMALPGYRLEFLMSERNQTDTFSDFDMMTDRLVGEILSHIEMFSLNVARISFIGHSLGNIIIRSALASPDLLPLLPKMYTFLSLSGPHLGMLYNNSGLVNMGMWFMQKWKKSGSLLQLSLKDNPDSRQSFLYKLSQKPGLEFFKNVLLVGSSQDRYVPYHSSRIEMCKAAQRESSGLGSVYAEMVANILTPVINNPRCRLIRYDVFHALPNTANTIIGRAAHIAVLDSEIFIEKFLMVAGLKYFK